jgi:hypothetical protein
MKLKDRHFDTVGMIEAESQALLNSLTENTTSRTHFVNWSNLWELSIRAEEDYLKGDGGQ